MSDLPLLLLLSYLLILLLTLLYFLWLNPPQPPNFCRWFTMDDSETQFPPTLTLPHPFHCTRELVLRSLNLIYPPSIMNESAGLAVWLEGLWTTALSLSPTCKLQSTPTSTWMVRLPSIIKQVVFTSLKLNPWLITMISSDRARGTSTGLCYNYAHGWLIGPSTALIFPLLLCGSRFRGHHWSI